VGAHGGVTKKEKKVELRRTIRDEILSKSCTTQVKSQTPVRKTKTRGFGKPQRHLTGIDFVKINKSVRLVASTEKSFAVLCAKT